MRCFAFALCFFAFPAFAAGPAALSAKVEKTQGTVLFNGKALKEGEMITANGDLVPRGRSFLR